MKTSKSAQQTSAQEECGVWLDTLQLKRKAKQKRLARPISKLLNPFADGEGYSLAVALNFTQTKMKMPKTKQSSISAFYTSQRGILNKVSTYEVPKMDPLQSCSSASTAPTPVSSGTKRRRETDLEKSDLYKSESSVDHDWFSETVSKPAVRKEHDETSHTISKDMYFESREELFEEFNPPQSKKRFIDPSLSAGDSQPPQAWSQDPLLTSSQYSDSDFYLNSQKNITAKNFNDYEPSFLNSFQSEETFGITFDLEGRTSTQKSFKHFDSSEMDGEKENTKAVFSNSPSKHSSLSHVNPLSYHKWTQPKTAPPQKHITDQLWEKNDKKGSYNSQFKWRKPKSSPLKKGAPEHQSRDADEDSMAMLFTQDSEGFRVIAHRGLQTRSPLKNQTNVSTGMVRNNVYKSLVEEDEEDEMLFTQDSQGNMVIKH